MNIPPYDTAQIIANMQALGEAAKKRYRTPDHMIAELHVSHADYEALKEHLKPATEMDLLPGLSPSNRAERRALDAANRRWQKNPNGPKVQREDR